MSESTDKNNFLIEIPKEYKCVYRRIPGPIHIEVSGWNDDDCQHDWKEYIGFTDNYKYCSKCNKKK